MKHVINFVGSFIFIWTLGALWCWIADIHPSPPVQLLLAVLIVPVFAAIFTGLMGEGKRKQPQAVQQLPYP